MIRTIARGLVNPARAAAARSSMVATTRSFASTAAASYEHLLVDQVGADGEVTLITLNRPKALNALCDGLIAELNEVALAADADPGVGAIVVTGSQKAFAAGADIKEMETQTYISTYTANMFSQWADLTKIQTPTLAAVNGYALGGGCELAMMCDIMLAGDTAKFGQPEITLGTIPGCGGTQRLIRAVGKSKAMEMCLTGNMMDAEEAHARGLVARVFPADDLVDEAVAMAAKIAAFSRPVTQMCKEAVNASYEMSLAEGVRFERRVFHSTFSTADQKEGMGAFVGKRKPEWEHK